MLDLFQQDAHWNLAYLCTVGYHGLMNLFFLVREGELEGETYRLRPGLILGRKEATVDLKDNRASGSHARVDQDESGGWVLVDLSSKNGTWVDNEPISRLSLAQGQLITIGHTVLEVFDPNIVEEAEPEAAEPEPQGKQPWNTLLEKFSNSLQENVSDVPHPIEAFHPPVALTFFKGLQAETRWVLGYGPRKVGANSVDLPVTGSNVPAVCFELLPHEPVVEFKTNHPDQVLVNGQGESQRQLQHGDIITIANEIEMEVELLK